jgi:Electron transfer DM13
MHGGKMVLGKHRVLWMIAAAAIVLALWYWFRPEKLFINKKVNEAGPIVANQSAQPIYTGLFSSKLHDTGGRATIYRDGNGQLSLHLTDFHTSNGPDVHVVLAASNDPGLRSAAPGKPIQSVEVGALHGTEGNQIYPLPTKVDFAHYDTVAIYCERFSAVFGTAPLETF